MYRQGIATPSYVGRLSPWRSGRSLKCLGIVDDDTHEAVTIHPEHALGGGHLVRILSRICDERGYPQIIRTDNGKEFTSKAMLNWAHDHGVTLRYA